MATPATEAVIAGSKGFALALLAPLTERVGTRPRIAADPAQALVLCQIGGLVVVEFQGEGSLRAIQELVLQGKSLRIVAAVPAEHSAAEGPLRALGVDLARWDGKADGVLGAVARQLQSLPPAAGPDANPPAPPPAAPAVAPPAPRPSTSSAQAPVPAPPEAAAGPGAGLFDDLGDDDFQVDVSEDEGAPLAAPSFVSGDGTWPANVPGPVEAADALGRGLAGMFDPPGTPLGGVADVIGALTEIERAIFAGDPQPVDTEPIRRAAVMRVRVAAAVATAPAAGGVADGDAVSAFLAEIDALLSDVSALAAEAPAEIQPSLEAIRNSLVKEAIDLSEVAQGLVPAGEISPAGPERRSSRAIQARVLSVSAEDKRPEAPRQRWLFVALAVAVAVAVAFHGRNWLRQKDGPPEPPSIPGAPAGMVGPSVTNGPRALVPAGGFAPDAAEIERFKLQEQLKGNRVQEVEGGALLVLPPGVEPAPPAK